MKNKLGIPAMALALVAAGAAQDESANRMMGGGNAAVAVTPDNFSRAESDMYFANAVKQAGGTGKFFHYRTPAPIENQTVIRMNRDTLYSGAVFDLDAGPVTITMPDPGKRFMSMQVIDEDEYTYQVAYGAGEHTLSKDKIGTRYVLVGVRTLVDPSNPKDVAEVNALQDAILVAQAGGAGRWESPNWDPASQKRVRQALLALGATLSDTKGMFGGRGHVDSTRHLIGSSMAWGGNPEKDAMYLPITPMQNDGKTIYRMLVPGDVPVDAFWSVSVYNAQGYFEPNSYGAYSLNSITAKRNPDGSVPVQFGGCDGKVPNCLPIMAGWNYTVRMYRPRAEVLSGAWQFPDAEPM